MKSQLKSHSIFLSISEKYDIIMGCDCSYSTNYHRLMSYYVNQTTTHGVRRISSSKNPGRRIFWVCVFLSSLSTCLYHCSYLIMNYNSNPKVTITEEKDAYSVEFPAVTICNLNVIKKVSMKPQSF